MTFLQMLYEIIQILLQAVSLLILVQVIVGWLLAFNVVSLSSDFVRSLWYTMDRMTEPLYRPLRRILPDFGQLDLAPMAALLLVSVLQRAIVPYIFITLAGQ